MNQDNYQAPKEPFEFSSPQHNQLSPHHTLQNDHISPFKIIKERRSTNDGNNHHRTFSVGKKLGKGAFAVCYECTDLETREIFAVKVVSKSTLTRTRSRQKVRKYLDNRVYVESWHLR